MKIGTDINLHTCRAEGYLMMEFNKRNLIKKGVLDKDCQVAFTATFGCLSHDDNGYPLRVGMTRRELFKTDVVMSWNDVMEYFEQHREPIWKYADLDNCPINFDNPTEHDLLRLASVTESYCGLE